MDLLVAVLLLVCVAAILIGMLGLGRRRGGLAEYRPPSAIVGVPAGIVAATSATAAANAVLPPTGSATLGAIIGLLFAVLAGIGSSGLTLKIVMGLFGLIGLVPAVLALLEPGCTTGPPVLRYVTLVIVAACTGLGLLAGVIGGRFHVHSPLGLVSALRVVGFLASPFGMSLVSLPAPAWVIACAGAALFGFAAGRAPDIVVAIAAVAVSLSAIVVTTTIGTPCTSGSPDDALTIIAFLVVYGMVSFVGRLVRRR